MKKILSFTFLGRKIGKNSLSLNPKFNDLQIEIN